MTLRDFCTLDYGWLRPFLILLLLASRPANAGLDHELGYDKDGLYLQNFQTGLEVSVIATEVAGALWLGNDDPLGHTFWQTVDSSSIVWISSTVLKYAFSRARPCQGDSFRHDIFNHHDCSGVFQSDGTTGQTGVDSAYEATRDLKSAPNCSGVNQQIPSGPAARAAAHRGRMYGCNLSL